MAPLTEPLASVEAVGTAVAAVPEALARGIECALPSRPRATRIVTSGIGASEAPARLLAWHLLEAGLPAEFCPSSRFVLDPPRGDLLVVFSQGLSPNACLALRQPSCFAARWLVTSVGHGPASERRAARLRKFVAQGVVPIVVPPGEETSMLVRWIGPTVALLVALRLADLLGAPSCARELLDDAPRRYRAVGSASLPEQTPALVLAGVSHAEAHAHRWKILETLLTGDPPTWDVLQLAHGPLQSLHGRPATLVVLERPCAAPLVERLTAALDTDLHRIVRLTASSDDALAVIEHAALVDALLYRTLRERPRDLFTWPGRGDDKPLYELGEDDAPVRKRP